MIGRVKVPAAPHSAIALWCLVAAGCASVMRAPTEEADVPASAPVAVVAAETAPVATPAETLPAPAAIVSAPAVTAPKPPPAVVAAPTAPAPQALLPNVVTAPVIVSLPAVAPLDFASLGTRLRQTKTIGVLTKLAVKNQVDDLLDRLRAYHKQQGTATLSDLRGAYDLLLLKVLSLLQDGDPPLARDIVQSRAAIWDILADPRKFIESNLMAGATP